MRGKAPASLLSSACNKVNIIELYIFTSESFVLSQMYFYRVFIVQAYQTSQYVLPRGGIFLGKWRSSFVGNSDGKMNVQSACALNNRYQNDERALPGNG
jgi:hypothetical protein